MLYIRFQIPLTFSKFIQGTINIPHPYSDNSRLHREHGVEGGYSLRRLDALTVHSLRCARVHFFCQSDSRRRDLSENDWEKHDTYNAGLVIRTHKANWLAC